MVTLGHLSLGDISSVPNKTMTTSSSSSMAYHDHHLLLLLCKLNELNCIRFCFFEAFNARDLYVYTLVWLVLELSAVIIRSDSIELHLSDPSDNPQLSDQD